MPDIQFEVITDLTVLNPQHIETNFDAVDAYLTEAMEPYTQMVVTEDSILDAKKTLAQLRKLRDSINSQKIAVKREWMKPYTEYEDKAKTLMSRVEKGISNLDSQLKDYDARRKEEKMAELRAWYEQEAARYRVDEYLSWDLVKNPKWANAGFTIEDAENAISEQVMNAAKDVDYITRMDSPFIAAMLIEYRRSRDLREALAVETRLREVQEAEERRKAQTVVQPPVEEEEPEEAQEEPVAPDPPQFVRPIEAPEPPKPKIYELAFRVKVTMQQAHALKAFFAEQGIKFEKI